MGAASGFPIDLVLFGMIAAFLVLRLRSILGKRTGFERPPQPAPRSEGWKGSPPAAPIIEGLAESVPEKSARPLPDPSSRAGQGLIRLCEIDHSFEPARFLDGAEQAFRLIVESFASGDRVRLRPLLNDETYRAFETAISAREAAGETQRTEIRNIADVAIREVSLRQPVGSRRAPVADIVVRFVSNQVNVTLGRDGNPVAGTDAVMEIADLWTFERDLSSDGPAWRLAATRSD